MKADRKSRSLCKVLPKIQTDVAVCFYDTLGLLLTDSKVG